MAEKTRDIEFENVSYVYQLKDHPKATILGIYGIDAAGQRQFRYINGDIERSDNPDQLIDDLVIPYLVPAVFAGEQVEALIVEWGDLYRLIGRPVGSHQEVFSEIDLLLALADEERDRLASEA